MMAQDKSREIIVAQGRAHKTSKWEANQRRIHKHNRPQEFISPTTVLLYFWSGTNLGHLHRREAEKTRDNKFGDAWFFFSLSKEITKDHQIYYLK